MFYVGLMKAKLKKDEDRTLQNEIEDQDFRSYIYALFSGCCLQV
jgi:hypothetical protein